MDDSIPRAITSINWVLSEIVGIYAALQAGAQSGVVGELPFTDLLSAVGKEEPSNGKSGDNVFIGVESQWLRMMLMSFQTRQLKFSYLPLREGNHSENDHSSCVSQHQDRCIAVKKPSNCAIQPNMFFGLIHSKEMQMETQHEVVVHKSRCLLKNTIDERTLDYLSKAMISNLKGRTKKEAPSNEEALRLCLRIINRMSDELCGWEAADNLDKRTIVLIQKLIGNLCRRSDVLRTIVENSEFLQNETIKQLELKSVYPPYYYKEGELSNMDLMNEVMDCIKSRVPVMLERLELKEFKVDGVTYTIPDVESAFIVCLGIMRATIMSDYIYDKGGVVAMGYNVNVAHELMEDVSRMPTSGYFSRLVPESTTKKRLIETEFDDDRVYFCMLFEVILSISVMLLGGLGPVVSMFAARQLSAPYRESTMHMGTSMSWAVSSAILFNTSEARDDWMACIVPRGDKSQDTFKTHLYLFRVLSIFSSFGPPLLWTFYHPPVSSVSSGGWLICATNAVFALPWLLSSDSIEKQKQLTKPKPRKQPWWYNPIYKCALAVVAPLALFLMNDNWVWLYLLEIAYGLQWLHGEISGQWIHKSTALLMLGMLGAVRLYDLS